MRLLQAQESANIKNKRPENSADLYSKTLSLRPVTNSTLAALLFFPRDPGARELCSPCPSLMPSGNMSNYSKLCPLKPESPRLSLVSPVAFGHSQTSPGLCIAWQLAHIMPTKEAAGDEDSYL